MPHRRRQRFHGYRPVHVTVRMIDEVVSLRRFKLARALHDAFAAASRRGFRLCHFSLQRNHIHFIVEAADTARLSRGVQGLKVRVARKLNPLLGRDGAVFADRYHAEVLDSPRRVRNALCYLLQNSRRHGLHRPDTRWVVDPFSSGRYFDGWREALPRGLSPPANEDDWPVARPKTWLLDKGWRRRGLIGLRRCRRAAGVTAGRVGECRRPGAAAGRVGQCRPPPAPQIPGPAHAGQPQL